MIVDDEMLVRNMTVRALSAAGFACEEARDGAEALARLKEEEFDLLVTDLRMPTQNGYRLALAVLEMNPRPFIAVLTGVAEPRIAKDLLMRGVEDIVFKPISYDVFATKVQALMARRQQQLQPEALNATNSAAPRRITLVELGKKIAEVSQIFPISQTALDVFNMASSGSRDAEQISDLIECDASLTSQILKIVNSSYYNRSGQPIVSTKDAVVRIGQRQIGELALAHNALSAMAKSELPWLDANLSWKRSLAAGVAMELLIENADLSAVERGLHNAAIMHPLGRIVLGTLFPAEYEQMLEKCRESAGCLRVEESRIFPVAHGHVLTNVLQSWGVPASATRPLTQLHATYGSIEKLPEPERIRAQLLKVAVYVARLAIGRWESWDTLDIPPEDVLRRLAVSKLRDLVMQVAEDVDSLCKSGIGSVPHPKGIGSPLPPKTASSLAYHDAAGDDFQALPILLTQMGHRVASLSDVGQLRDQGLLVNCVGVSAEQLPEWINESVPEQCGIVTDQHHAPQFERFAHVVTLPMSYKRFEECLRELSKRPAETPPAQQGPVTPVEAACG